MKILFVGASGTIGGGVLNQCLAHPKVMTVVAFVRRPLSPAVSSNSKLECVIKKDFAQWKDNELRPHADAVAMIWAIGTNTGSLTVDLEYPLAFLESFTQLLEKNPERPRFRYVLLSGKFVVQDQDKGLWFLDKARKLKGQLESKTMALAEQHASRWQVYIVRPGGVASKDMMGRGIGVVGAVLGKHWAIRIEELGAFMTEVAVNGGDKDGLIENAYLVERGRELLKGQAHSTAAP